MSFKCNICAQAQSTGTKPNKVVVSTRNVSYPAKRDGTIPTGTEIVQEIDLCNICARG